MPDVDRVHAVFREIVDRGMLEMRPDAGGELLRAEDAALCPQGLRVTVLSYAMCQARNLAP